MADPRAPICGQYHTSPFDGRQYACTYPRGHGPVIPAPGEQTFDHGNHAHRIWWIAMPDRPAAPADTSWVTFEPVGKSEDWTPTTTDRDGDWVSDPRGRRTYLIDAYLADPPLQDDWALLANADPDDVRANLQTLIERLVPRPVWHPEKPGNVEGIRELLADPDFDRIGGIHNDDVRALLANLDRARAELAALRSSPATEVTVPRQELAWLLGEASVSLSSSHDDRCVNGYGPDHCCTVGLEHIDAIRQAAGITNEETAHD
jgi:hypothetical protein